MTVDISKLVTDVIARTPGWLRRDLASDDAKARASAEETLAAMLTAALKSQAD